MAAASDRGTQGGCDLERLDERFLGRINQLGNGEFSAEEQSRYAKTHVMTRKRQSDTLSRETSLRPMPTAAHELAALTAAVRVAVGKRVNWRDTAQLVASALERRLPSSSILTPQQRAGDPETYKSEVLHSEPDGSFSIVALVWLPGQVTPIHDHVTWCVFGVIQGTECEELFELDQQRTGLVEAGYRVNRTGDVSGFAPPGDIHRVRNAGDLTAISLHIYGTDVARIGSSVRRHYNLRVRPSRAVA
jgi:predicted metal-dependent enzyme (double-stranded beta helix superfamily)